MRIFVVIWFILFFYIIGKGIAQFIENGIFDWNEGSRQSFESIGFISGRKTGKGHSQKTILSDPGN